MTPPAFAFQYGGGFQCGVPRCMHAASVPVIDASKSIRRDNFARTRHVLVQIK
jgi:hypothetical protein